VQGKEKSEENIVMRQTYSFVIKYNSIMTKGIAKPKN
jgi:hypothetical protein